MSGNGEAAQTGKGRLAAAVREVKNRAADREDVVVDLKETARARLELLAAALDPVFAEVPAEVDVFDFAISSGLQPRLWIDAVAHVALARDHRTFLFVRDTRFGRDTIAEGTAVEPIAEAVTGYIAERIVERERALAGDAAKREADAGKAPAVGPPAVEPAAARGGGGFRSVLAVLALGALFGVGLTAAVFWDTIYPWLTARF